MTQKRSLTAAQIQYLKIGPKVGSSVSACRKLQESLSRFEVQNMDEVATLSNIPKFTLGNFEGTVNNFGVLLHRNFVGATSLLQAQKFGKVALNIDRQMEEQKDKQNEPRKLGQKKTLADPRTVVKGIYQLNGNKLLVTLKSFSIQSLQTNRIIESLPVTYLRLITFHVPSSKLVKIVQSSLRQQGSSFTLLELQKLQSKVHSLSNPQHRYSQGPHLLQKSGQQFTINLPCVQIYHPQSDYRVTVAVDNRDIVEMIDSDMDNVEHVVRKYLDVEEFYAHVERNMESKRELEGEQ